MSGATADYLPSAAERQPVLGAFAGALRREAHVFSRRPDLIWQQLYNRLQFEVEPVQNLLQAQSRRLAGDTRPWLHNRVPVRESENLLATLQGHARGVNDCAISSDGSFVVSASADGTLKIWDVASGQEQATLAGHVGEVRSCAISPDRTFIVSAGRDKTLRSWDTATGHERDVMSRFEGPVTFCDIATDGTFLVTTNLWVDEPQEGGPGFIGPGARFLIKRWMRLLDGRDIRIWDLRTLSERARLIGWGSSCGLAPDSTFVVSASSEEVGSAREALRIVIDAALFTPSIFRRDKRDGRKCIKVWDASTGVPRAELGGGEEIKIRSFAVSPDRRFIVGADYNTTLWIWTAPFDQERRPHEPRMIGAHSEPVRSCAISPDSSFVVSASDDHTLKIWDPATCRELSTLVGHTDGIRSCAVSPDSSFIASASGDGSIKLWRAAVGRARAGTFHSGRVNACAASPDGRLVVSASDDRTLKIWDAASGTERATLTGHDGPVTSCAVSANGTFLVSGGHRRSEFGGRLKIWDLPDGSLRGTLSGSEMRVYACVISRQATFIVSTDDAKLRVWDVPTVNARGRGRRRAVLKGHLANPSVPGTAVQLGTVIASNVIKAIAISPDDSYLVSGGDDCALRLWRVPKKRKWRAQTASAILAGHVGVITCCAISPDGQSIVSGGWDNALLVWHSTTAELRDVLLGHSGRVTCCAISPDGQFIVSGSWDNTLFIWDLATGEERSVLLGHTDHVTCCAISPDSRLVASGGEDQTLRIWDLAGSNLATVFLAGSPTCVEFARTHPLVVSGDSGGSVYLLDLVGAEYGLGPSGSQSGEADLERLLTT